MVQVVPKNNRTTCIRKQWTKQREKLHVCICKGRSAKLTLTSNDLDSHARMSVPMNCVELDEACCDWLVQICMFHWVRVHIALKNLQNKNKQIQSTVINKRHIPIQIPISNLCKVSSFCKVIVWNFLVQMFGENDLHYFNGKSSYSQYKDKLSAFYVWYTLHVKKNRKQNKHKDWQSYRT